MIRQEIALRRLWSLWDMQRAYADQYLSLGRQMADAKAHFYVIESEKDATKIAEYNEMFLDDLAELLTLCEEFSLKTSTILLKPRIEKLPQSEGEFEILLEAVTAELKSKMFLFVPEHLAQYYEWDSIVSDEVINAFPRSYQEIRGAGNCFALGLYTACVFHSMRAAEIGLRSLGREYNIKLKGGKDMEMAEWREILDGLNAAVQEIENLPNSTIDKEARLQFCSEAAAQFRFFKNGWRIRAAHARAIYNEPQAKEAIDHVRAFFETLAIRLKE